MSAAFKLRPPDPELKPLTRGELRSAIAKLQAKIAEGGLSASLVRMMRMEISDLDNELRRRTTKGRPGSDAIAARL